MCAQLVEDRGDTAIGLDPKDAEFEVDLSDRSAVNDVVRQVVRQVEEQYGLVDGVIATWVRRVAPTEEFAGAGIGINAGGPGKDLWHAPKSMDQVD